jgi:hypothetical protein
MSEDTPADRKPIEPAPKTPDVSADILAKLSAAKQAALQALAGGAKKVEAARTSGVCPRTIYRWIKHDIHFKAAFEGWRSQLLELGRARALGMSGLALDTLDSAMEKGDARTAFNVAKSLGLFRQERPGPDTPGEVARERARAEKIKRIKIVTRHRKLEEAAFRDFRISHTVYDIDDRIWLLMIDRKRALKEEPEATRREREEIQADEREDDEERQKIDRAIRDATE